MLDLVERKVIISELINSWKLWSGKDALPFLVERLKSKELVPNADAVSVIHGRWVDERPNTYTRKVKCSVCNGPAPFICRSADYYGRNMHGDFAKTKYCPNCGAKMDKIK